MTPGIPNNVYDVTAADFREKVIDASQQTVVIVDFWADWCGPCKMLGPILEKIAADFSDKVVLAKVNIDENQDIAQELQIKSIPTVKIIKDGAIANEFMGALPEADILEMLKPIIGDSVDNSLLQASQFLEEGKLSEAESLYKGFLEKNPGDQEAIIGLARVSLDKGDLAQVGELLIGFEEHEPNYQEAAALKMMIEFHHVCEAAGGLQKCTKTSQGNPDDLEARYTLGCCYALEKKYEDAFEEFLAIVRKNIKFGDGKAKDAIVSLFSIVGFDSEITNRYRNLLTIELF